MISESDLTSGAFKFTNFCRLLYDFNSIQYQLIKYPLNFSLPHRFLLFIPMSSYVYYSLCVQYLFCDYWEFFIRDKREKIQTKQANFLLNYLPSFSNTLFLISFACMLIFSLFYFAQRVTVLILVGVYTLQ